MPKRVIIVGGPHTGKTTLAGKLKDDYGIAKVMHSTDDLIGLGWSEASQAASEWFNEEGDWIIEGITTARALRKWLLANPDKPLDAEILVIDEAFGPLLKGQKSMTAGVHTVFREIEPSLTQRGARIQKLKNTNDAIQLFEGRKESVRKMADDPADKGGNDPTQAFQSRLTKMNGDAMAFATQLFDENFRLREDKRTITEQLEETKKKLPTEGSVVLSAEKAKDYEAYKVLGKPDELKTRIEAHANLETENAKLKKKDVIREVAELHGYKPSVLEDRDTASGGLEFVIKQDAQKRKAAFVKDGDKETPITEYAETNWADYLPSLKVEQGQPQPVRTGHGADPKPVGQNGQAAYDQSHKALKSSGKYTGF